MAKEKRAASPAKTPSSATKAASKAATAVLSSRATKKSAANDPLNKLKERLVRGERLTEDELVQLEQVQRERVRPATHQPRCRVAAAAAVGGGGGEGRRLRRGEGRQAAGIQRRASLSRSSSTRTTSRGWVRARHRWGLGS